MEIDLVGSETYARPRSITAFYVDPNSRELKLVCGYSSILTTWQSAAVRSMLSTSPLASLLPGTKF